MLEVLQTWQQADDDRQQQAIVPAAAPTATAGEKKRSRWGKKAAQAPPAATATAPKAEEIVSSSASVSTTPDPAAPATVTAPTPAAAAAAVAAAGAPSYAASGARLQAAYYAGARWKTTEALLDAHSAPAAGSKPVSFSSPLARTFPVQVVSLIKRTSTFYARNVPLNYGRFMALLVLQVRHPPTTHLVPKPPHIQLAAHSLSVHPSPLFLSFAWRFLLHLVLQLIFGVAWYRIAEKSNDLAGIQTLIAAIFFAAAFAMIMMNTVLPALIGARPVFYRETSSKYYHPVAYAISIITLEIPWMCGLIISTVRLGSVC